VAGDKKGERTSRAITDSAVESAVSPPLLGPI
jgi:hypothetical protein